MRNKYAVIENSPGRCVIALAGDAAVVVNKYGSATPTIILFGNYVDCRSGEEDPEPVWYCGPPHAGPPSVSRGSHYDIYHTAADGGVTAMAAAVVAGECSGDAFVGYLKDDAPDGVVPPGWLDRLAALCG